MTWGSLILAGLRIILALITGANNRKLIQAGEDKKMAQTALQILEATEEGKKIREHIRALSDSEADDLWDRMTDA